MNQLPTDSGQHSLKNATETVESLVEFLRPFGPSIDSEYSGASCHANSMHSPGLDWTAAGWIFSWSHLRS
jgi:hypothetical protein